MLGLGRESAARAALAFAQTLAGLVADPRVARPSQQAEPASMAKLLRSLGQVAVYLLSRWYRGFSDRPA